MELQVLMDKRAELERQFDIAQQKRNEAEKTAADLAEEMGRLQGGYRTLTELIDSYQPAEPNVAVENEGKPSKEKK
jgi:sulfur carrier protein ThiS